MTSHPQNFLSAAFLESKGIACPQPLRDWLTRAAYLSKNRSTERDRTRYVNWALSTIENAVQQRGGVDSVDWRQLSPVMPSGSAPVTPTLLVTSRGTASLRDAQHERTAGRAALLEETLRRSPAEVRSFVTEAFSLYDRDVALGKRTYGDVSFLEMLNLAKNLYACEVKRRHTLLVTESAPVAAAAPKSVQPAVVARQPQVLHTSSSVAPERTPAQPESAHVVTTSTQPLKRHRGENGSPSGAAVDWTDEESFFVGLTSGKSTSECVGGNVEKFFVGTSCEMERNYSRYEPSVEDIRPLAVLERAFGYIQKAAAVKHREEGAAQSLAYLNEQLKGMRQDLRVQNISNDYAVRVYEYHARLCLEIGDLGEFNQCQAALKRLYASPTVMNRASCCVSEFFCYRLAYLSLSQQYDALSTELINFTNDTAACPDLRGLMDQEKAASCERQAALLVSLEDVKCVLRLCAACDEGDCALLCEAVQHFSVQMSFLVRIHLQRLRVRWLREILCGVRGAISLRFLMANLGFTQHRILGDDRRERSFWLDGSEIAAEQQFRDLFTTLKLTLPKDFSFSTELARDAARDHSGASRNSADKVPSLDAVAAQGVLENYIAYLGTRKDAASSPSARA